MNPLRQGAYFRRVAVAVLALGAVAVAVAPSAASSSCNDPVFENAALSALAQRNKAIGEAYAGNYASAKADLFVSWRAAIEAREPCNLQLRTLRKHLLRHLGALWLSYAAMAAGDITDGLAFLVAASKEGALANAAVSLLGVPSRASAGLGSSRVTGAVTRVQPRLS